MRFSKVFQPQNTATPKRDSRVRAVQTAAQLLESPERTLLIQEIKDLCAAPPKHYQEFYETLINNFAEFVQLLESIDHPAYTWLDHQLRLAKTALKMREQFLLVGESLRPIVNEEEALWHYVTFSSALLRRIGLIFTHYQVSLCNEQGVHVADWLPFSGSMNTQGNYYKLREITDKGLPSIQSINQLLARQLMPSDGFSWIAKNPAALTAWLGIVEGESSGGVSYQMVAVSEKQLYVLAEQEELLEQLFAAKNLEQFLLLSELSEKQVLELLPPLHGEKNDSTEQAVAFFDWMESQNQVGTFTLLNAQQYLLSPDSLMFIAGEAPGMSGTWFDFYKKSLTLGLTTLTPSDKALQTFLVRSTQLQQYTPVAPAPTHETNTTELFHQTLQDHNEPIAPVINPAVDTKIHQHNLEHTIESLNNQGLMVSGFLGAAHQHQIEKNVMYTQQEQTYKKQIFNVKEEHATTHDKEISHAIEQRKTTRQQQLRRMIESQYPQANAHTVTVKSSFSYTKRT
jgi:hypothetical protein